MQPSSVEIYRIIEESDTLATGGLLLLPLANPIGDAIERTANGIEGVTARQVEAGDVLVLQPTRPTGLTKSRASRSPLWNPE